MKRTKRTLLILFLTFISSQSLAQWDMDYFDPDIHRFHSVFFINKDTGWVGGEGEILRSTDGGETWTEQLNGLGLIKRMYFIENNGWAIDGYRIWHTDDYGDSWQVQLYNGNYEVLHDLTFINQDTGWVVGNYYLSQQFFVLSTVNGGDTWTESITDTCAFLSACNLSDSGVWLGGRKTTGGGDIIARRSNNGSDWQTYSTGAYNTWVLDLSFPFIREGWAIMSDVGGCEVRHTVDSGQTWVTQLDTNDICYYSILFLNDQLGWVVGGDGCNFGQLGTSGIIMNTHDGGSSWEFQEFSFNSICDVFFIDSLRGWAVGGSLIYRTVTGGEYGIEPDFLQQDLIGNLQIKPNPFSSLFEIDYSLAFSCYVSLKIVDVFGRTIFSDMTIHQSKGKQHFDIDAKHYPSGMYFLEVLFENNGHQQSVVNKLIKVD